MSVASFSSAARNAWRKFHLRDAARTQAVDQLARVDSDPDYRFPLPLQRAERRNPHILPLDWIPRNTGAIKNPTWNNRVVKEASRLRNARIERPNPVGRATQQQKAKLRQTISQLSPEDKAQLVAVNQERAAWYRRMKLTQPADTQIGKIQPRIGHDSTHTLLSSSAVTPSLRQRALTTSPVNEEKTRAIESLLDRVPVRTVKGDAEEYMGQLRKQVPNAKDLPATSDWVDDYDRTLRTGANPRVLNAHNTVMRIAADRQKQTSARIARYSSINYLADFSTGTSYYFEQDTKDPNIYNAVEGYATTRGQYPATEYEMVDPDRYGREVAKSTRRYNRREWGKSLAAGGSTLGALAGATGAYNLLVRNKPRKPLQAAGIIAAGIGAGSLAGATPGGVLALLNRSRRTDHPIRNKRTKEVVDSIPIS